MPEQELPSGQEEARRRPVGAESSPGGVGSPLGSETLEVQALPALDALLQTNFMEVLPSVKGLKDLQPHAESHEPFGDDRVLAFGPLYLHDLQYDEYIEAGMADADGNTVLFTVGVVNAELSFGLSLARNVTDRAGAFLDHFNANLWDPVFMGIAKSHTGTPGVQPDMDSSSVSRLYLKAHDITEVRRLEFTDTDQGAGNNISLQQRGDAAGAILEVVNDNDATQYSSPTYRRLRLADPVGADDAATKRYVDALSYAGHTLLDASLHTDTLAAGVTDGSIVIGNVTPKWSELVISIPAANVRNVLGVDNGELRPSWKAALDATNPVNAGGAAAPGTSLVFSHRDHVHAVAASHSGSAHHAALTIGADAAHSLAAQALSAVLAASGQTGHMSGAMFDALVANVAKLAGIEATADVTDATNVAGAGAVMDSDIAPAEGFLRKTGAGAYTAHKSNLAAAVAPGVNDDTAAGYSVGSVWIDTTNDDMHICVDATNGAAVWLHLNAVAAAHDHTAADGSGVLTNDEHDGYSQYDEIAAPGAPAANKGRLYVRSFSNLAQLFYVDESGYDHLLAVPWENVDLGDDWPVSVTGSGAITFQQSRRLSLWSGTTALSTAYARSGEVSGISTGVDGNIIDWAQRVLVSLKFSIRTNTATGIVRFTLGKDVADGMGALDNRGVGIQVEQLSLKGHVHDGVGVTTTAQLALLTANQAYRLLVVSDGVGNVEWFLDGVSIGVDANGPSVAGAAGECVFQVDVANGVNAAIQSCVLHALQVAAW